MELFIHLAGFLGAWFLVVGPLYQAAIELSEEAEHAEDIQEAMKGAPRADKVSVWWWLLPPVYYVKRRRATERQRDLTFRTLDAEQRSRMMAFTNKAGGWMTVAGGAFLIALKETWELVELIEWPVWVFWVAVVVLSIASIGTTVNRISRTQGILQAYEREDAAVAAGAAPTTGPPRPIRGRSDGSGYRPGTGRGSHHDEASQPDAAPESR